MIREKDFLVDFNAGRNAEEAAHLKWWILCRLRDGPMTADQIYEESECGDIAMYLCLHELVTNGLIIGLSPYDNDSPGNHREMHYELATTGDAQFFSSAAVNMRHTWKPEEWEEGTVLPGDSTAN